MGIVDNTDDALNKAAEVELEIKTSKNPGLTKRRANLYFRQAMKMGGNPDYKGNVLD